MKEWIRKVLGLYFQPKGTVLDSEKSAVELRLRDVERRVKLLEREVQDIRG